MKKEFYNLMTCSYACKFILLFITVIFFIVGCRQNETVEDEIISTEVTLDVWSIAPQCPKFRLAPQFRYENPDLTLNIRHFNENWQQYDEQLSVAFMSGNMPDMFLMDFPSHKDHNIARMLADWLPIMTRHPDFNKNDYFMNVLDAMMFEGQLNVFPTYFTFGMLAANTTVPGLSDAMAEIGKANATIMLDLSRRFDPSKYIHQHFNPVSATIMFYTVGGYIQNFIDMEARTANFNNQDFIDFISLVKEFTSPSINVPSLPNHIIVYEKAEETELSQTYLFLHHMPNYPQYLLSIEGLLFEGNTPIVNHRGELIIRHLIGYGLGVTTTQAQQEIAWEFVRFTQAPENNSSILMVPTYIPLFRSNFERSVPTMAIRRNGWQFASGSQEQAIEDALILLKNILEMPMVHTFYIPPAITEIIVNTMELYADGLITAEQVAVDLQNRITIALMEIN